MIEKRSPTINELDNVVSDKYVWLGRVDCHSCTVNSKIFEYLDLPENIIGIEMDVDKVLEKGLTRMGGCIILDGSFGSRTAALLEPYEDDPSTNGALYYTQEEVDELVLKAHKSNLQLAFHTLGERSIEQILNAYEKGSIEKGKIADFVILSENIYEINPEATKEIEVEKTIKSGKIAYSK